ncbi:MAG TPA: hypothetical protein VFU94_03260 [Conexibacter sp.]|nr:hypothetical protein [Conexibacter sp.]
MFDAEPAHAGGIGVVDGAAHADERPAAGRLRAVTPAELAWIALVPCALATLAAILVLGPPVGHLLAQHSSDQLWPSDWWESRGRLEPVKHGRYLVALVAPLLYAALVLAASRRPPRLQPAAIRALVAVGQVAAVAFAVVQLLAQHEVIPAGRPLAPLFEAELVVAAGALALAVALAPRAARVREAIGRAARERAATRFACAAVAVLFATTWLIKAIDTDRLVEDAGVMNWTLNDPFAVLNGRTPLVDYHQIYAKLLPYPTALVMALFGETTFVYTLFMTVLSILAALAVYAVLRRLTRSPLFALALFVPFLALSASGDTTTLPAMWPMRYGTAYLIAWLTARHLDGARPRRLWPLFLVGAIATIDDLDFGVAALAATVVALLVARPPRSRRQLGRTAAEAAAGLLGGVALVSAFTLARSGSLPSVGVLLEWPRIFLDLGWFALPMPNLGVHVLYYGTFAAAIGVAAVRLAMRSEDRLLTSMLAWAGVFGLLAGAYYVGRSDEIKLESLFSTWAFALALLAIVCVRALAARAWRAPTIAELLVFYGIALALCTVKAMPRPDATIARLTSHQPPPQYRSFAEHFIRPHVQRGEKVVILLPLSFRIAREMRLVNVAPYELSNAVVTRRQMQTLIDTIQRENVTEIFMPQPGYRLLGDDEAAPEQVQLLEEQGFEQGAVSSGALELRRVG